MEDINTGGMANLENRFAESVSFSFLYDISLYVLVYFKIDKWFVYYCHLCNILFFMLWQKKMKTSHDILDHLPIQNVSITIVVLHCQNDLYLYVILCVETFSVMLYYKIFNCVISFVDIFFSLISLWCLFYLIIFFDISFSILYSSNYLNLSFQTLDEIEGK